MTKTNKARRNSLQLTSGEIGETPDENDQKHHESYDNNYNMILGFCLISDLKGCDIN